MGNTIMASEDSTIPYALLVNVEMPNPADSRISGVIVLNGGYVTDKFISGMSYNEMSLALGDGVAPEPYTNEMDYSIVSDFELNGYNVSVLWTDYVDDDSPSYNVTVYTQLQLTDAEQSVLDDKYGHNDYTEPEAPEIEECIEPAFSRDDIPDIPEYHRSITMVKGYTAIFGENGHYFRNPVFKKEDSWDGFTYTITDDSGEYSELRFVPSSSKGIYNVNVYNTNGNAEHLIGMEAGLYKLNNEYYYCTGSSYSAVVGEGATIEYHWEIPNQRLKNKYFYDLDSGNAYFGTYSFNDEGQLINIEAINFSDQKKYSTDENGNITVAEASAVYVSINLDSSGIGYRLDIYNNSRKDIKSVTSYCHVVNALGETISDVNTGYNCFYKRENTNVIPTGKQLAISHHDFINNSTATHSVLDYLIVEYTDGTSRTIDADNITFFSKD